MQTPPDFAQNHAAPQPDAWSPARDMLAMIVALFGAPRALARRALDERTSANLQFWLRALESVVRILLLILAAALPKPKSRRACGPAPSSAREGRASVARAQLSRSWAVFSLAPRNAGAARRGARKEAVAPTPKQSNLEIATACLALVAQGLNAAPDMNVAAPEDFQDEPSLYGANAAGLAARLNALTRVIANPKPFALRLRRRLLDGGATAAACLNAITAPLISPYIDDAGVEKGFGPADEALLALCDQAFSAALYFQNSS